MPPHRSKGHGVLGDPAQPKADNVDPMHDASESHPEQGAPSKINLTGISCISTAHTRWRRPAANRGQLPLIISYTSIAPSAPLFISHPF